MKAIKTSLSGKKFFAGKLALLLLCVGSLALAVSAAPKSKDGVVQVNGGNALFNSQAPSQAPSLALSGALKQNPNARQFRVNWHFGSGAAGAGNGVYTALYKRAESTLKIFGKHTDTTGEYYSNYLYIYVEDDTIHQVAEKYKTGKTEDGNDDNDELAYFPRVTEFGAEARVISSVAR